MDHKITLQIFISKILIDSCFAKKPGDSHGVPGIPMSHHNINNIS